MDSDVRGERMERKAIFITGGGSGIGRAVARHFVGQSWFVGIAGVNRAGIDETAALLPEGASSRHVMDVRDRAQLQAALDVFATASGGRLRSEGSRVGKECVGQCRLLWSRIP